MFCHDHHRGGYPPPVKTNSQQFFFFFFLLFSKNDFLGTLIINISGPIKVTFLDSFYNSFLKKLTHTKIILNFNIYIYFLKIQNPKVDS
jgi:hypothetical protein